LISTVSVRYQQTEVKGMYTIAKMEMTHLRDRGVNKLRVNFIKDNHIFGFIRPVNMGGWNSLTGGSP